MFSYIRSYLLRYEAAVIALPVLTLLFWPQLLSNLFNSTYMPHGHCYLWMPSLVWLHVSSDMIIGLSYVFISVSLGYLVYKASRDIPFHKMFLAFGLFIISCGFTHFMSVWNVYDAIYWLSGSVKVITAVASALTAVSLPFFIPRALALVKSAKLSEERQQQIESANLELENLNKRLREIDQLKTDFFTNVSHELRTPLTLILAPLENFLSRNDFPVHYQQDLKLVQQNARTLLRHVNDLLDVSKLEVGKLKLKYVNTDLAWQLRKTASLFESLAAEQKIVLKVEAPDSLCAPADSEKVERIFINLLSNAFKFTPASGTINCRLYEEAGNAKCIIKDSGPGINAELKEVLFERFQAGAAGLNRRLGSTGLGLSITKEFVELHHGTIDVKNAEEGGAEFIFSLPLTAPDGIVIHDIQEDDELKRINGYLNGYVQDYLYKKEHQHYETNTGQYLKGKPNVLVIEDNIEMNKFICDNLNETYNIYSAFDGEEGLTKAIKIKPDLILTDIMMPKISGDKLVAEFKRNNDLNAIPVVLLSAKADDELRIQLLKNGAQDYLLKPFSLPELKVRIDNLVKTKIARELLERELKVYNKELPVLVEEVTRRKHDVESSLRDKDALLKEIHHRVKNNLQVISSLLNLQSNYIKDAESLSIFNDSRDRVRSMAIVHERLYQSDDLTKINFGSYIKDLASYLFGVYRKANNNIHFRCDCDEIYVNIEYGVPLGLIMNELITNSLKHAFPDNYPVKEKIIHVTLKKGDNGDVLLTVKDNGVGLPEEMQPEKTITLGLQLVNTLIQQIEGTVNYKNNNGAEFSVCFV